MKKLQILIPFSILFLLILFVPWLFGWGRGISMMPYILLNHVIPSMNPLEYFQLFFMIFLLYIYFSTWKFYGDIDFSSKKTRINLIASILVVLCIWFYWFSYTPLLNLIIGHSAESLGEELTELRRCMAYNRSCEEEYQLWLNFKIGITLVLTSHIWIYWILNPLIRWIKNWKNLLRKCPYCAENIKKDAIKCKHCGEALNS